MTDQIEAFKDGGEHDHRVDILIDRIHYKVPGPTITGAQLRAVPKTPIPADRDLFLIVPGGTDRKISDTEIVPLHNGVRFFTAPGQINPG
jgi:hypothetical protein